MGGFISVVNIPWEKSKGIREKVQPSLNLKILRKLPELLKHQKYENEHALDFILRELDALHFPRQMHVKF